MADAEKRLIVGVPSETCPGETRVAQTPATVTLLARAGLDVIVQAGAGEASGYPDAEYEEKGARIVKARDEVFADADIIVQVRAAGANPTHGTDDLERLSGKHLLVAMLEPLSEPQAVDALAKTGAAAFALELLPRISRAQSMDVLSSMANIAGYKAVLLAAAALPRMFPMMMTAAGTITPARVFVIGAGVAGLQAIATAHRLGAVVHGYDVRPAVKEQVESLGAKFVELPLETADAEDKGGYAKEMGEETLRKQREMMLKVVGESDVVITTAAIPGKKAPILVTQEMVAAMAPGSIVVDLAAERGGNCALTQPGENVEVNGVTIMGPLNVPAGVPYHASQMYARNVTALLQHIVKKGALALDLEDQITNETLVTRDGEVREARLRELLGLGATTTKGGGD